ncbi:Hybrid PKS-NRPS synthetase TAS1 [Paramyrothecium foliicola]|nr:Hybrid PKS-NRPS synthetase TAS1 [Paramyrothecium foliicola]
MLVFSTSTISWLAVLTVVGIGAYGAPQSHTLRKVKPFKIDLAKQSPRLIELVKRTKLPEKSVYPGLGATAGIDLAILKQLKDDWVHNFRWHIEEEKLNRQISSFYNDTGEPQYSFSARTIERARCDMALVGGVAVQLYQGGHITRLGGIFSPSGQCRPFDSQANGTVTADAVTAVVIKKYSDAIAANTPIYANILGTGYGSDGASEKAGFQIPSPRGIAEVVKAAWKTAQLSPERFRYAEIYGSGTPIGDAPELEGLSLVIKELGGAAHPFTVGSTKGNIGNTQVPSMHRKTVPATLNYQQPNKMIDPDLPLSLAKSETLLDVEDILAVSAAGWDGINSHILLGFPRQSFHKRSTTLVPEIRSHGDILLLLERHLSLRLVVHKERVKH